MATFGRTGERSYTVAAGYLRIDREASAVRIERDVENLSGPRYTRSDEAIRRYAYTPEYRNALDYFAGEFEALGFDCHEDPVEPGRWHESGTSWTTSSAGSSCT